MRNRWSGAREPATDADVSSDSHDEDSDHDPGAFLRVVRSCCVRQDLGEQAKFSRFMLMIAQCRLKWERCSERKGHWEDDGRILPRLCV